MLLNNLNRHMFKPFRSHRGLLGWSLCRVREDSHEFQRGFLPRDASMRPQWLWPDKQNWSHNVSQKCKRIKCFSDKKTILVNMTVFQTGFWHSRDQDCPFWPILALLVHLSPPTVLRPLLRNDYQNKFESISVTVTVRARKRHIKFEHINFLKVGTTLGQPAG